MTLAFDFHPEAQAEFAADVEWYDDREVGVGGRFAEAVRAAIDAAVDDPAAWVTWPGWDREPVVRSKGETGSACDRCVAKTWQESRRGPIAINAPKRVCAGQLHNANADHQQPLSVPRFPWYYWLLMPCRCAHLEKSLGFGPIRNDFSRYDAHPPAAPGPPPSAQ